MSQNKLYLIDAHALCYRSFYAIKSLTTSKGQPTNAVFGFVNTLRKILSEYHPPYMAVCFDSKGKTLRQQKFSNYKIQRPVMPKELIEQIPVIKEVMEAYRLPILEKEGYEADDLMATLTARAKSLGWEVCIVSDDKDMYQLADENVTYINSRKEKVMHYKDVKEMLGFEPKLMTDFISLAGDSADNIPGVDGIGEVTARQLLSSFGTLENIYEHIDDVKSAKVKEKLTSQEKMARLSKELAVLNSELPFDFDPQTLKTGQKDKNRLYKLFKDLEFKRFAQEYSQSDISDTAEATSLTITLIEKSKVNDWLKKILEDKKVAIFAQVIESDEAIVHHFWLSSEDGSVVNSEFVDENQWKKICSDKKISKTIYGLKDFYSFLLTKNIALEGECFDIRLAGYVLGANQLSIPDLVWDFLKITLPADSESSIHVAWLFKLQEFIIQELAKRDLTDLLRDIEQPLSLVLAKLEREGVNLDLELLRQLSKDSERKILKLNQQLYTLAGEEFNLNSPKQLSHILFEKLKLPVVKKTKTGFSTDEEVLSKLAVNYEMPSLILEYRQLAKLKSTYIDALPKMVDEKTGHIHAQFDQTGTETGRLSSRRPNLQNIPIRTELGREIRRAFIPSKPTNKILASDYSQIELRFLAHLSGDEAMSKAFQSNQDIHRYTASLVNEIPEKDVTDEMRDYAKRINFGIIYGMSSFGLAKDLGISQGAAQDFIDKYFLRYPKVKAFMDHCVAECEEKGYVTTMFQRRRYIPEIHNSNMSIRQFAQRQAINTPVQGSAADLIKIAMIRIQDKMEEQKMSSRMIITVHDELVFDVPQNEIKKMTELVRQCMENAVSLNVPIKVGVYVGNNWQDLEEVTA